MVRRSAELFVRMGLVRGEGGDYVLSVLSTLVGCWATVGMVFLVCVHVRHLLTSIDTNMDINYADDSKARTRQTRRRSRSKRTLRGNSRENKRGRTEEGEGCVRGGNKW